MLKSNTEKLPEIQVWLKSTESSAAALSIPNRVSTTEPQLLRHEEHHKEGGERVIKGAGTMHRVP